MNHILRIAWNSRAAMALLSCLLLPGLIMGCKGRESEETQTDSGIQEYGETPSSQSDQEDVNNEQRAMIEQLEAIGYLGGTQPAPEATGLLTYDESKVAGGPNFYVAGHAPEATLMDIEGNVLHQWQYAFEDVWPEREIPQDSIGHLNWRRAYLYENGDLLAIFEGYGLIRLNKDSELLWEFPGNAHHDLKVLENGDIYVLSRKAHMAPRIHEDEPILEDYITMLDPDGNVKRQVSLLEAAENSEFWPVIQGLMPESGDLFHTNTLEYLDGSLEHLSPLFKEGNILTSIRSIHALAIVDMESEEIVWCKLGTWSGQHQPILLPNGNMILFDNNRFSDYSRVLEIEPFTENIVWYYMGTPPNSFFTEACGSIQPLENGNILVVESEAGRAFEIQRDATIVWEYVVPQVIDGESRMIPYLFDLVRLPADFPLDWIE